MGTRSYDQYCAVARALDVVGERWTLLVLRELVDGPMRYADLLDRLQTISTDVLTRRLRTLEEAELVERVTLPPPAARVVYQLTDRGRQIEPVLVATARFGLALLGEPRPADTFDPRWIVLAIRALLHDRLPPHPLTLRFETPQGSTDVRLGPAGTSSLPPATADPDVVVRADLGTLAAAADAASIPDLLASGRLVVEGDAASVHALGELLGLDL